MLAKPAQGGLAEFCVADASKLAHVPAGVSATQLLVYQRNMRTESLDEATVYPLAKIVQAHRDLEFGASVGKIIVAP